jgi:hypothetical protein
VDVIFVMELLYFLLERTYELHMFVAKRFLICRLSPKLIDAFLELIL